MRKIKRVEKADLVSLIKRIEMNEMENAIYEYSEYVKSFRVKLNEIRDSDILNDYKKQVEENRLFEQRTISMERK